MSAEHLVMSQLRLLERLPLAVEPPGLAAAAGEGDVDVDGEGGRGAAAAPGTPAALAAAVRSRCGSHRSKDVKALGARVVATWERRGGWQGNGYRNAKHQAAGDGGSVSVRFRVRRRCQPNFLASVRKHTGLARRKCDAQPAEAGLH